MRTYPTNSPEAAARLVAIGALCDGVISASELRALHEHRAAERLGLTPVQLQGVIAELVEDLCTAAQCDPQGTAELGPMLVGRLMAEVDRPDLKRTVVDLMLLVSSADRRIDPGEEALIASARLRWKEPAAKVPPAMRAH